MTLPKNKDQLALVIVDVQNDFCSKGGFGVPGGDKIVPTINSCTEIFEHVIVTQDWHPSGHLSFASSHRNEKPFHIIEAPYGKQILWPDHCIQGTNGAALHPRLNVTSSELLLRKGFRRELDSYSAFFENDHKTQTGLCGYLKEREINHLFFCGLSTDFCVLYSVLDARRLGFSAYVIDDACRGINLDGSLARAWDSMKEARAQRIDSYDLQLWVR